MYELVDLVSPISIDVSFKQSISLDHPTEMKFEEVTKIEARTGELSSRVPIS